MLTIDRLKKPEGRLDRKVLWPRMKEPDADTMLEAFLVDAYTKAAPIDDDDEKDEFAENWAYFRAFDDVHNRMLVNPSTYQLQGQGSASWLLTQIQDVEKKANEYRDAAGVILDAWVVEESADAPVTRESACVHTSISFSR